MVKHRLTYLKTTVIGFGFLSGLWVHLGFDPQSFVFGILQTVLLKVEPQYASVITALFFGLPIVLTLSSLLGAHSRGGWFGLAAVALAFAAGVLLNATSIPLMIIATVVGFLTARKMQK